MSATDPNLKDDVHRAPESGEKDNDPAPAGQAPARRGPPHDKDDVHSAPESGGKPDAD